MESQEADKKAKRNAYLAEWRAKNRDKTRAAQRKYYERNKELCDAKVLACQKAKRSYYTAKTMLWQKENPDKVREVRRRSYQNNRATEIARVRTRAGKIKHGTLWTSPAEQLEIDGLYQFCDVFPWYEVDHIAPLNGKTVSGLHVLGNLQVLTRAANRAKGNKFCPAAVELANMVR